MKKPSLGVVAPVIDRPVLAAMRSLLMFKKFTTIAEIASICGASRKHVLDTINANRFYIWKIPDNGHITRVDPRHFLTENLWKSGKFYRESTYGAWSVEGNCLNFEGNAELRERLQEVRTVGALGDNYETKIVIDTPENRKALEDAGLRPWSEAVIDDRLWQESPIGAFSPTKAPAVRSAASHESRCVEVKERG